MTADLRQATRLLADVPVDPLAQAWEQILAAVVAKGRPRISRALPSTTPDPSD